MHKGNNLHFGKAKACTGYHSKYTIFPMTAPRLDFLCYAHDGRGLGHASRTIGICMALRRLAPEKRLLFVSGTSYSQELIGPCRLDWLKLPSYETEIVAGKSRGVDGPSGFTDPELAELRRAQLASVIHTFRPRVVLVDHQPQGKHKELLGALAAGREYNTRWVLGVRGVVGDVPQLGSELARETFGTFYDGLIWYGDSGVLGTDYLDTLAQALGISPFESGYVSRLGEIRKCRYNPPPDIEGPREAVATVAMPWLDGGSECFLEKLTAVLPGLNFPGRWHLYIGTGENSDRMSRVLSRLNNLDCCRVMAPGAEYVASLLASQLAVIYGGYNSITDVLGCGLPTLVLLRDLADREQQLHLDRLVQSAGSSLVPVSPEQVSAEQLRLILHRLLAQKVRPQDGINLHGAVNAARFLLDFLQ